jgi:tripartite-type tricarboxylate transporter receptor subunit TctC
MSIKTNTYVISSILLVSTPATAQPQPASTGSGQTYPNRPVRVIVPLSAGGSMDTITRAVSLKLGDALGQSFVVDNRPSAGALIALDILSSSAPDGHTLMMIGGSTVVYPILYKSRYDMRRHVAQVTAQGYVLVVQPSLQVKTVPEFVQYLKANPDKVNYSSSGIGSPLHMSGELFKIATGTRMTHIPYKGMAPAYADLVGGQVQASFPTIVSSATYVNSGRLRALAVTTPQRVPALPNMPTFAETGVQGMVVVNWYGLTAPLKTPQAIIDRLAAATSKVMRSPDMMKNLVADGSEAVGSTPAEFAAHVGKEHDQWSRVVKAAGIRVN